MSIFSLLQQRRSTRHYDPSAEISRAELEELLAAATHAPSGNNSQPWRFIALTDHTIRRKLLPAAYHQEQVLDASALLVILADRAAYEAENLRRIHWQEYEDGCFNEETRDFLTQAAIGFYRQFDETVLQKMRGTDIGLCVMSLMLAAQERGWDTIPMTGYQPDELRQVLAIPPRYEDILLLAVGKGVKPGHRTTRRPVSEILTWNQAPQ